MRALLFDVNVLLALLDDHHIAHRQLLVWLRERNATSWATCPITENGFVRIASQPRYPNPLPVAAAVARLRQAYLRPGHQFWADDVSLLDTAQAEAIGSPGRITDTYLLALAKRHEGLLVTLDRRLSVAAVEGGSDHLAVVT